MISRIIILLLFALNRKSISRHQKNGKRLQKKILLQNIYVNQYLDLRPHAGQALNPSPAVKQLYCAVSHTSEYLPLVFLKQIRALAVKTWFAYTMTRRHTAVKRFHIRVAAETRTVLFQLKIATNYVIPIIGKGLSVWEPIMRSMPDPRRLSVNKSKLLTLDMIKK